MREYTTEKGTKAYLKNDTVNIQDVDLEAVDPILDAFLPYYQQKGAHLVITSAADGVHSEGSHHHPKNTPSSRGGWALDLRTWAFREDEAVQIASRVNDQLGEDYDVIYEDSPQHFHAEKDVITQHPTAS
ncbi:hypothetical protein OSG_eHP25_00145 [environmental Halophage eHP-25]|nr:hypothetical protein OSG_eHP25_00145 [environmental Halophage eHP-25]